MFGLLDGRIRTLIKERKWEAPTLAQERAIKPILEGKNVLLIAPTGSGKTESVFLPILHNLVTRPHVPIACLYITPLRALNRDLLDRLLWWCESLSIDISVRHGDTTSYQRSKQLKFPDMIMITTPESLQALLTGKKMREHLRNVKYVIIDEIHELVENKRGAQLGIGLERLRELASFQTIGLSATIGSPEEVAGFLGTGEVVWAISQRDMELEVESPSPLEEDVKRGEELFIPVDASARLRRIKELIEGHKSALVFTNTREAAEVLSSRFRKLQKGFEHAVHHSSLSKKARIDAEADFKGERLKALFCTSSLELGIDIGSIDLVIQYQSPRQVSKLTQRVGRSGHSIGRKSKGVIIASGPDDILETAVIAKLALEGKLERVKMHRNALDVLANQIIGMSIEEFNIDRKKAFSTVRRSFMYRDLEYSSFEKVLRFLAALRMVWLDDGVKRGLKAWRYYYENLSTIPDVMSYKVIDNIEGVEVGHLDEAFVAEHATEGSTLIVKGRPWRVLSVMPGQIDVEPAEDIESAIPAWEGELIPVPKEVAEGVAELRKKLEDVVKGRVEAEGIRKDYRLSEEALKKIVEYVERQLNDGKVVPHTDVVMEEGEDFVVVQACNGTLINETIARFLAGKFAIASSVAIKADPYRIMVQGVPANEVLAALREGGGKLEETVASVLDRTQMFKWRFFHNARRFGAVGREAKWGRINMRKMIEALAGTPVIEETMREIMVEKLDLEGAKGFLDKIKDGKTNIIQQPLSPMGRSGLEQKFRELVTPVRPEKGIFEAFRERLLSTRVKLVCLRCGAPVYTKAVRDVDKEPRCFKCASRVIAAIKPPGKMADVVIRKGLKATLKERDEKEMFRRLELNADLVLTYGKKMIIALAGRGVGPETAIRILAKQKQSEEEFLKDILEAERQYAKTKKFWAV